MRDTSDLSGRTLRGAVVIDRASAYGARGGIRWHCRCLGCGNRFTAFRQALLSPSSAPACPRCLAPLRSQYGKLGGSKARPCKRCGRRGHYQRGCRDGAPVAGDETLHGLCRRLGLSYEVVYARVRRGVPVAAALNMPTRRRFSETRT